MSQVRLVVERDDAEFLERIANTTGCKSRSTALSIFISRFGNLFLETWEAKGIYGPSELANPPEVPPIISSFPRDSGADLEPIQL